MPYDYTYPARGAYAVTPSDTAALEPAARALWVGTQGDVALLTPEGQTVTFVGVQGVLQVQALKVMSTNTDATDIVALY